MTNAQRLLKRVGIVSVALAASGIFFTAVFLIVRPSATCFDGRMNGGETGMDCGGPCSADCPEIFDPEPFVIREAVSVPGNRSGEYDAVVRVYNPNDMIGASSIGYDLILRDASGAEVGRMPGTGFILPQESKYVLGLGIPVSGIPAAVEIVFRDALWQRFSGYQERPELSVYQARYEKVSSGPFFGEALGTLRNDSPFDFRSVAVTVVLRDVSGVPVALNRTEMNTLLSGDVRDFMLRFPNAFPGEVATVDTEVDADFYREDSFIGRYRTGTEQFQSLR